MISYVKVKLVVRFCHFCEINLIHFSYLSQSDVSDWSSSSSLHIVYSYFVVCIGSSQIAPHVHKAKVNVVVGHL